MATLVSKEIDRWLKKHQVNDYDPVGTGTLMVL